MTLKGRPLRIATVVALLGMAAGGAWYYRRETTSPYRDLRALRSDDPITRGNALRALGKLTAAGEAELAMPALVEAAEADDPVVRAQALMALEQLGGRFPGPASIGRRATEVVAAAMADRHERVRATAATALGSLRDHERTSVPALLDGLDDPDPQVRGAVVGALARYSTPGVVDAALARLTAILDEDDDPAARVAAADALASFPEQYDATVGPILIEALRDPAVELRRAVAYALEQVGDEVGATVPALIAALRDEAPAVRVAAAGALGRHLRGHWQQVIPALSEAIRDADPEVRQAAIWGLGFDQGHPDRILPAFVEALRDADPTVRMVAAGALERLGEAAEPALAALDAAVMDPAPEVRAGAEDAIREIENAILLRNAEPDL